HSAGSHPAGRVNPFAIELLRKRGMPVEGLRSKSWDEFAVGDAPRMDLVVTVCDSAAGEACPLWPGTPIRAHWGVADPAAEVNDELRREAFFKAFAELKPRIDLLLALPMERLDRPSLKRSLDEIGRA